MRAAAGVRADLEFSAGSRVWHRQLYSCTCASVCTGNPQHAHHRGSQATRLQSASSQMLAILLKKNDPNVCTNNKKEGVLVPAAITKHRRLGGLDMSHNAAGWESHHLVPPIWLLRGHSWPSREKRTVLSPPCKQHWSHHGACTAVTTSKPNPPEAPPLNTVALPGRPSTCELGEGGPDIQSLAERTFITRLEGL